MKLAAYINRFIFGEVSPLLYARGDLTKYGAACKTLVNFIPLLQGPIQRRGGTRFIARTGNGDKPVALLNFAFSSSTAYILEVGDGYLRVFYQGAPVGDGQGGVYQIATPWRQADLFLQSGVCALKWVQSGDVMYIVSPGQAPQKLSRYGHTDWRVEELPGWNVPGEAGVLRPNAQAIALFRERLCLAADQTVYMSQSGAFENFKIAEANFTAVTISSGYISGINTSTGIVEILHSAYIRMHIAFRPDEVVFTRSGNTVTCALKDGVETFTQIGVVVDDNPKGVSLTADATAGRVVVGGSRGVISWDPRKGSVERDNSVDTGYLLRPASDVIAADDPIEIKIYSEQMDRVEWLCPTSGLLVGTTGGEFLISETTTVDPLGPENIKVVPETAFGSSSLQALRVGSVVIFVQRSGRKAREFAYDYAGDNYLAMDLTVAAEHITEGGLTALVWQSEPIETLWAARPDGQLLGFTYSKDQDMTAWHRHSLGGGGLVSQLAVIPAAHGGRDELWLSARRMVEGQTIYCLERLEPGHEFGGDPAEAFFVDSGLTFRGSGLTEISGLDHLEGREVAILADGGVQRPQVVTGGRVTLAWPAEVVHVGLPYESRLTTVNLDANLQDGTAQGRIKRLVKVLFRLVESGGGAAGADLDHLEDFIYRRGHNAMDRAVPLSSEDLVIDWPYGWETDGTLTVVQRHPLPFTLAAMVAWTSLDELN